MAKLVLFPACAMVLARARPWRAALMALGLSECRAGRALPTVLWAWWIGLAIRTPPAPPPPALFAAVAGPVGSEAVAPAATPGTLDPLLR